MALLCAYMRWHEEGQTLEDYLEHNVFRHTASSQIMASSEEITGFADFLSRYKKALALEQLATEVL